MSFPATLAALTAGIVLSAALAIRGHYDGSRRILAYVFKPLTVLLLLTLAVMNFGEAAPRYGWGIALGLVFSLAGDVFLMLPRDRFREGLASFLLAHVCYIAAFTSGTGFLSAPLPFVIWGVLGLFLLGALWPGVPKRLRVPVLLYVLVLLSMAAQAGARTLRLKDLSSLLAASGATLFVASDALLALDRFRAPFRSSRAVVLSTYFLAQWLIALSVRTP
ncbi:MAG: lysoplasmalogenase [Thermoanaerobaculia bacterium]